MNNAIIPEPPVTSTVDIASSFLKDSSYPNEKIRMSKAVLGACIRQRLDSHDSGAVD